MLALRSKTYGLALLASTTWCCAASEWQMSFPVTQEGNTIAHLELVTDGKEIVTLSAAELTQALDLYLNPLVKQWLAQRQTVSAQELAQQGIVLRFNPQTLEVEMSLLKDASALRRIELDHSDESSIPYSRSTRWSWQNNVNLAYERYLSSDYSQASIDWLGGANIGGESGVNALYSFYVKNDTDDTSIYRGRTQLFHDNTASPWRLSAGDVEPVTSGHLPSLWLGGVSWERAYSQIQPYRQLRNNGTQPLDLAESAEVTIYINDVRITRLRLAPGRYELDDLPLSDGVNNVRLEIQYMSGGGDVITYSQFYNGRLLKEGLSDFSISFGVESNQIDEQIEYGDKLLAMGFYEYGFTPSLTFGINGLSHQEGHLAGLSMVNGSALGNVTLRSSMSYSPEQDDQQFGYAVSVDYSQKIFGSSPFGSPNFRVSAELLQDFNASPWILDNHYSYKSVSADYQWFITDDWDASLFASYRKDDADLSQYNAMAQLNWRNYFWRVGVTGEYEKLSDNTDGEFSAYVNIEFFYDLFGGQHRFSSSYNSDLQQARLELRKPRNEVVGDYGYEISAETQEGSQSYMARGEYTANRMSGLFEVENLQPKDGQSDTRFYGNVSSSLVIADGHVGWGRPSIGPNALVDVHPTLKGSPVYVNSSIDGDPEAISTVGISNIVPLRQPHQRNNVNYDVPEAPLGYSLDSGITNIKPGSTTTHIIKVGSDAMRTVIATALTPEGEPLSLLSGEAMDEQNNRYTIFTNRAGRFVLEGVTAGKYIITLDKWLGVVDIGEDSPILTYFNDLIMHSKEEHNE